MNKTNPKIDTFLSKAKKWQAELEKLRTIILGCNLTEEMKWGQPCYTFEDHNVIILGGFKEYCALMFVKGALLKDPKKILIQQTQNVQAARQLRFTNVQEITKLETIIKEYIREAIEIEKAGLKINFKTSPESTPEELQKKFNESPDLKNAFKALTPGRQRAYILYFSGAKQSATREARIEKYMKQILKGKGLND